VIGTPRNGATMMSFPAHKESVLRL